MLKWLINLLEIESSKDRLDKLVSEGYYVHLGNGQYRPTAKGEEMLRKKARNLGRGKN